jgi:hypothetical protein
MTRRGLRSTLPFVGVAVLAIVVREAFVLRSGGWHAGSGYDTSVYYAAADGLIHGRVPYRDFVLLHPPAVVLALTPAAFLGRLTSDHYGFALASTLFTVIGGANAALVGATARRWGLPRRAALVGGLFYAVWFGAAASEVSCRLEPLGNLFLLLGLAALGSRRGPTSRALLFAGAFLGLAVSTKIWFFAPALAIAVWLLVRRRSRDLARVGLGFLAALVVVDGPFLVLSRGTMFARVVLDQIGRHPNAVSPIRRWAQLSTIGRLPHNAVEPALLILGTAVLLAAVIVAWRRGGTRLFAVLVVLHVAVLLLSPSWFAFYADFAAVPLALTIAGAAGAVADHRAPRVAAWLPVAGAAAISVAVLVAGNFTATMAWQNSGRLIAAVRGDRCVMSDAPAGLIELNALDADFARGCPVWVDVTGRTYFGRDSGAPRRRNKNWQQDLLRYLESGQSAFLVRANGDGLTRRGLHVLARRGVIARVGRNVLFDTDGPAT